MSKILDMLYLTYPKMFEDDRGCTDPGAESLSRWPQPGELWSLLDMYNFVLFDFHQAIIKVANAHKLSLAIENHGQLDLAQGDALKLADQLDPIAEFCAKHELVLSSHSMSTLLRRLRKGNMNMAMLRDNTRSLHEALFEDARRIRGYIYRNEHADILANLDEDWAEVFRVFPEVKSEVRAAVDLWALNHSTASVFHSMRACETALRFLARKMKVAFSNKPTEWGTWGALIKKMDEDLVSANKAGNGPKKDSEREFLGGVVSHLRALQEKRDAVMHVRREFDQHEARSVIFHVQGLLDVLAARYTKRK